jgi:hypothetical protein
MSDRTQKETNDEEWDNPGNWAGWWPFKSYFSKRDSRVWVPFSRNRWSFAGGVINHGHWAGSLLQAAFTLFVVAIIAFGFSSRANRPANSPRIERDVPKTQAQP